MADDLFTSWLPAIWTKATPPGVPPTFMLHRFLASDRDLAPACRVLQDELREPDLVFRTWQGLLPKGKGAPRLQYAAPKKAPKEEELVTRIMTVERLRREVAEEVLDILRASGQSAQAFAYYGMEEPEE